MTITEIQNKNRFELLSLIVNLKISYKDVDSALELVGKFSVLDWLGDKLTEIELRGTNEV
jgi:hypothetical protein